MQEDGSRLSISFSQDSILHELSPKTSQLKYADDVRNRLVDWYSKNFKFAMEDAGPASARKASGSKKVAEKADGGSKDDKQSELHPMLLVFAVLVAALAFREYHVCALTISSIQFSVFAPMTSLV